MRGISAVVRRRSQLDEDPSSTAPVLPNPSLKIFTTSSGLDLNDAVSARVVLVGGGGLFFWVAVGRVVGHFHGLLFIFMVQ